MWKGSWPRLEVVVVVVGVVSNYLDEKLHQPPITDIQLPAPLNPLHIWLTRYSEGYDTVRRGTQTLLYFPDLIRDEVCVSVCPLCLCVCVCVSVRPLAAQDETIDCRTAAGFSVSYRGAHPTCKSCCSGILIFSTSDWFTFALGLDYHDIL